MGRFATTVEFYSRYREPYPPSFFEALASKLALRRTESLLDIGCGPGLIAIGMAPFVARVTGIDPEPAMLEAAETAAAEASVELKLVPGRIEEFSTAQTFDIVTIGRALHWLDRDVALPVLERIVSTSGHIAICGAPSIDGPVSPWVKPYEDARSSWSSESYEAATRRRLNDGKIWFAGSSFAHVDTLSLTEYRQVTIAELVGRAFSKSNTSPAKIGERRAEFEAQIIAALEPFAQGGVLQEQIVARASIFARQSR